MKLRHTRSRHLAAALLCACLAATSLLAGSVLSAPQAPDELERRVQAVGAPGAVIAVVRDGAVQLHATGTRAWGSDAALDVDTPMALGSVTKFFTALAVLQLVERGDVSLDQPVADHLPWLVLGDEGAARSITVRQLLSHTSGLSTRAGNLSQGDRDRSEGALRRRVDRLSSVDPGAAGGGFAYSNANYQILGALIEAVSGQSYADYLQQRLLAPLGMSRSFVLVPPPGLEPATGHYLLFGWPRPAPADLLGTGSAPQGGLYASARDMGVFLQAMLDGHPALPSAALREEMMRPQPAAPRYGLGLMVGAPGAPDLVHHGGQTPGFDALLALRLSQGLGVAVMTNAGPSRLFGATGSITYGTASTVLGDVPDVPATAATSDLLAIGVLVCLAASAIVLARVKRRGFSSRGGRWAGMAFGALLALLAGLLVFVLPGLMGYTLTAIWVFQPDTLIVLLALAALLALGSLLVVRSALRQRHGLARS